MVPPIQTHVGTGESIVDTETPLPAQDTCLKLGVLGEFPMAELSLLTAVTICSASPKPSFKAMVFPVVMGRCESWTIKKAECRRIDAFEL